MLKSRVMLIVGFLALLAAACGFSPTAPFSGFDENGSRVSGTFESPAAAQSALAKSGGDTSAEGIRVYVQEDPSLSATVGSDGTFTIIGVPAGSFTLVFERDGTILGEISFHHVCQNQEITIVLVIVNGRVEWIDEKRDRVSCEGECPRGVGFWCQNQGGTNPNLSADEFQKFSEKAAELLSAVLGTEEEIAAAVCDTGDQLLRHLATLGRNLASGTITMGQPLVGEDGERYPTVGDAFEAAVAVATTGVGDRNKIKDVVERINENRNHEACDGNVLPDDDSDGDSDDDDDGPPSGNLICHGVPIPRGALPPPGECKAWDPNKPAGQQGPPGNCATLGANLPDGWCLVDHNGVV